ncbi:germ cell-specific gene 1-like protein [Gymnodraco acuticeps]|uniref:Germ cell-specific gene 1-like protein n=1 Tax=Gymnodraco acuticeps TaxID=8218 RepID=A0A6P8U4W1_GYMAC|nr:germ cell-specific gene 1-like protein [Gymnodraco acuticeps]
MKAFVKQMRSPRLSFLQTTASLFMAGFALLSSFWCEGKQKVPKPLCSPVKHQNCIPVPGVANATNIQFSWETGDDRFVFPTFHTGLFLICEENIYKDAWAMMWFSVTLEILYVALLMISCSLLSVQLCIRTFCPSTQRCGQLLNAFAALSTVLGGLLGMVGHMMFMQVFQTTASMGPEDFKPHSYGYSWAFYMAWCAFTLCMSAGVSTLNNYTKTVLMVGPRRTSSLNACSFNIVGLLPPYYTPVNPALTSPPSPPRISHLSPYYKTPSASQRHSDSLPPLPHSNSFPPPPSHLASASSIHRLSLPSQTPSYPPSVSPRLPLQGHQESRYDPGEDYSPL